MLQVHFGGAANNDLFVACCVGLVWVVVLLVDRLIPVSLLVWLNRHIHMVLWPCSRVYTAPSYQSFANCFLFSGYLVYGSRCRSLVTLDVCSLDRATA